MVLQRNDMGTKKRYNIITMIQDWLDTTQGQTFLNYAYSWGAAIVILGALFKLTKQSWADPLLYVGMGTEVLVFFIAAFDRPFSQPKETDYAEDSDYPTVLGSIDNIESQTNLLSVKLTELNTVITHLIEALKYKEP